MKSLIVDVNNCIERSLNIDFSNPTPVRITIDGFEHRFVPFAIADSKRWVLGEAYLIEQGILSNEERLELDLVVRSAANTRFNNSQPRLRTKFYPKSIMCLHEQGLIIYLNKEELANSYFDTCELVSDILITNYRKIKSYLGKSIK